MNDTIGSIAVSVRCRAYCILRYGIQAGLSNAVNGIASETRIPGTMIPECP